MKCSSFMNNYLIINTLISVFYERIVHRNAAISKECNMFMKNTSYTT